MFKFYLSVSVSQNPCGIFLCMIIDAFAISKGIKKGDNSANLVLQQLEPVVWHLPCCLFPNVNPFIFVVELSRSVCLPSMTALCQVQLIIV